MSWLRQLNRIHAYEVDFPRLYADHVAWQAPVSCLLLVILLALSQVAFATDYQIEVIVFKRTDRPAQTSSDEPDGRRPNFWPHNMIAIAPPNNQSRAPFLWAQAVMLEADPLSPIGAASSTARLDGASASSKPVFLLASESRADLFKRRIAQLNPSTETVGDDPDKAREQLRINQRDALLEAAFFPTVSLDYRSLDTASRQLNGPARSIRRSSLYELLLHQSWRQPIGQTPTPILIQGGEQYGDQFELEGTLSIRRQRYLHVDADLRLTQFSQERLARPAEQEAPLKSKYPDLYEAAQRGREYSPTAQFNLNESRRLRSGELHYLDHPALGVLLLVNRSESSDSL